MGGTGSGRKREGTRFDWRKSGTEGSLNLAQDIGSLSFTNPDSNFLLIPKSIAWGMFERERANLMEVERQQRISELGLDNVPTDPQEFYWDMGCPILDRNGNSVLNLADYQWEVWNSVFDHRYSIVVKSQKVGITTTVLLADLQLALLPKEHPRSCRGKEILVIAQSIPHARLHLQTLRQMIQRSKYVDVMRVKPTQVTFKDEVTKVGTIFLENPDDPSSPTRIIGLGPKEGAIWSYKSVKHVHVSDIVASDIDYSDSVNAALTRLANTNGTMLIETPPRGPQGRVYEIWRAALEKKADDQRPDAQFWPIKIPVGKAVQAGLVTQEYLDNMKATMGAKYNSFFEAEFIAVEGNVFPLEQVEHAVKMGELLDVETATKDYSRPRSMGIDPGFGSSQFAIVISQTRKNRIEVVFARQFRYENPSDMVRYAWELSHRYNVKKVYADGSNPGYIRDLKRRFGEPQDYERMMAQIIGQQYDPAHYMKVVPVNFNKKGREMLAHAQYFMSKGELAINEDAFSDLVVQIRSAQEDGKGGLDKKRNTMDLFDAWRLSLLHYQVIPSRPGSPGRPSPIGGFTR